MYCISDVDYLRDFTMMLNDEIIDCFSEKKPEEGVVKIINEVVNDIVQIKGELDSPEKNYSKLFDNNKKLYKNSINKINEIYNGPESYINTGGIKEYENYRNKCRISKTIKFGK